MGPDAGLGDAEVLAGVDVVLLEQSGIDHVHYLRNRITVIKVYQVLQLKVAITINMPYNPERSLGQWSHSTKK